MSHKEGGSVEVGSWLALMCTLTRSRSILRFSSSVSASATKSADGPLRPLVAFTTCSSA